MLPLQQPLAPLPPLPPLPPLQPADMGAQLGLQGSPLSPQPGLPPVGLPPSVGLHPQQPVVQVQVQQQPHVVVQAVQPQPGLGLNMGMGIGGGQRPLLQQDSFTSDQRALFKQMSLGIQVCALREFIESWEGCRGVRTAWRFLVWYLWGVALGLRHGASRPARASAAAAPSADVPSFSPTLLLAARDCGRGGWLLHWLAAPGQPASGRPGSA